MAGQNLTFKLILDGDNKGLVSAVKQSESSVNSVLESIKQEAERLKKTSEETNKATAKMISDEVSTDAKKASDGLKDVAEAEQKVSNESSELEQKIQQIIDELNKAQNASKSTENGFNSLSNEARNTANESAQVAKELNETNTSSAKLSTGLNGLKTGLTLIASAFAAVGVGLGIRELAQAADSYTNLSARIKIATQDGGNFTQAMSGVHQVALATNSNLTSTADLFTRLNAVGKDMGVTQQQALELTKTVTEAIKIGGGSAEAADGSLTQFIQAMQGGVLRGEEFNSIMEGGYGLAEALARGLGVTTGELRKMAEAGELSSERVVKALQTQSASVQATYDKFPTTISNALQRISTSWEILIGKMDQSNGASATVAQWLVTIANNIQDLDVLLNDMGQGFEWIGSQINKIDTATIETLKSALVSAYETLKSLASTVGDAFEITFDLLNTALGAIFNFNSGVDSASDKTNGLTKLLQVLNVALGFLNDGFKGIGIAANLLTGAFYSIASASNKVLSALTWGDVSKEFAANADAMATKANEYYTKASDGALKFESAGKKAWDEINKTQDQKNADSIAKNQLTLDQLSAQEAKHLADYKAISDQRLVLEQQLYEAKKTGNQASIDLALKGIADLEAKEKAYQVETQKINSEKIKAAQDWVNAQLTAIDGTAKASDIATQKTIQTTLAARGLKVEFDNTGKGIVSAMEQAGNAVSSLDSKLAAGRKGAQALGLDLDIALNRVSEGFKAKEANLNSFTASIELMGVKGKQSAEVVYQAWVKWLETAKSQAEIDFAMSKLKEFETQGVISTKQVELGVQAIRQVMQKLPDDMNPVEQAFERLGIKTKEQLKLAAQSALADFNTIQSSGQATAESLRQAYERTIQAAVASGDQAVIASTKAKAASLGLSVQIEDTGKATVQSYEEMDRAAQSHASTVSSTVTSAYREMGAVAREEAQNSLDAWNQTLEAKSIAESKERSERNKTSQATTSTHYTKSNVRDELKNMGYDDAQAEKIAQGIFGSALARDQTAMQKNMGAGGLTNVTNMLYAELRKKGLAGYDGSRYIEQALQQFRDGAAQATLNTIKPKVYADSSNETSKALASGSGTGKTVQYNLNFNGKTLSLSGDASQEAMFNDLLRQLETINKSS
ncbi:tape measure protein [Acinetobacter bereziniae]|uniref:tape measure protein n=1 Tax=Acinetobacter bereziniae TaxID=106648 RepID=UPI000C2BE6B7|nr:tape measure protein [Acinetobacter bereziniae]ATZ62953.1 tape measure domain-containing protein [Acinetobacter bereziniae]